MENGKGVDLFQVSELKDPETAEAWVTGRT
jgi:hypothetical protein